MCGRESSPEGRRTLATRDSIYPHYSVFRLVSMAATHTPVLWVAPQSVDGSLLSLVLLLCWYIKWRRVSFRCCLFLRLGLIIVKWYCYLCGCSVSYVNGRSPSRGLLIDRIFPAHHRLHWGGNGEKRKCLLMKFNQAIYGGVFFFSVNQQRFFPVWGMIRGETQFGGVHTFCNGRDIVLRLSEDGN